MPCSHFPCGSVDWNRVEKEQRLIMTGSLPLRKCGLKYCFVKWLLSSWHLSLPLRKCGLKYKINLIRHFFAMSLPLRKCGLKYDPYNWMSDRYPSLPLRKCGLKWLKMFCTFVLCWVTSLAEVWIEIPDPLHISGVLPVTSLAEVWIEMFFESHSLLIR